MKELIAQMWQFISTNLLTILGLVIATVTALGVFYGPRLAAKLQKNQEEQDNKLKAHFVEIKIEVQTNIAPIVSSLDVKDGKINIIYHHGHRGENNELPILSDSFSAHFPKEVNKLAEYSQKIEKHNKGCEGFYQQIKDAFESKNLNVVSFNSSNYPTCIYDFIFSPLFSWWLDRHQGKKPLFNFTTIEEKEGNNLYVCGYGGSAIARVGTNSDYETCKQAIIEVAENREFEETATKITSSAGELSKEVNAFKEQLNSRLNDIEKFWPGTASYIFKKEIKKCPKCKEIFSL